MNNPLKKLRLKKTTIMILDAENEMRVQGGKAATQPAVSCFVSCQPSIKNPCIPPTERCTV